MPRSNRARGAADTAPASVIRCAIYTRKSTEEGLQQEFNSLDAQREAAEAFILSQKNEGWHVVETRYDDGGYTGGNMERPALQRLLADINQRAVDCVVVYKVDRLSRSLLDFARIMEVFEKRGISFVSVTQQFNTTNSLGRLTLNILLSFAQFEREIISERTRDKLSAARRKGKWIGGMPVLGYDIDPKGGKLLVNAHEARIVREMFELYLKHGSISGVLQEIDELGWRSKEWTTAAGRKIEGKRFHKSTVYAVLKNALYTGVVVHKEVAYPGEHERIIDQRTWERTQSMLQQGACTRGAVAKNKYGALLRGLLFCAHCGTPMMHTTTQNGTRRYRYYVCYKAQQKGWKNCKTKSVQAEAIEGAVLNSIRRLGTDPHLAEAVLAECMNQLSRRREDLLAEQDTARRTLRQLNLELARLAADTSEDSGARFERMGSMESEIRKTEHQLDGLARDIRSCEENPVDPEDLRQTLAEFESVWVSLATREQEQLVQLLVAKVGYDGVTGKVTVNFRSTGAKELCQGTL